MNSINFYDCYYYSFPFFRKEQDDKDKCLFKIDSYETQSQLKLLKTSITYEHKRIDKFDTVLNNTINDASLFEKEDMDIVQVNETLVSNRSNSPDLLFFNSDLDDDGDLATCYF